jgi:aryl-alcohol dehydrogenase-like predicted oxidoreductase
MIYRPFGKTGITASAVGLGTWNIGNQWGEIDETTAFDTIQAALDAGVTLIDTAEAYGIPNGLSEERIGRALGGQAASGQPGQQGRQLGQSTGQAVPMTTKEMFVLCCQASLYRLRTDYLDVYLCHISNLPEEETDSYLEGFEELKRRGMIRCYGISTNSLDIVKRFNQHGTCRRWSLSIRSSTAGPSRAACSTTARSRAWAF